MRLRDEHVHVRVLHTPEKHGELCRRRRNPGVGLCCGYNLEAETLCKIRPTVMHDDHLGTPEWLQGLFPGHNSLVEAGQECVAICLERRLLVGMQPDQRGEN